MASGHTTSDWLAMMVLGWLLALLLLGAVIACLRKIRELESKGAPKLSPHKPRAVSPELVTSTVEIWKKTVDVQQHFNQIGMDIRKSAVTVLVAVIGAAGYAADKGMRISIWTWEVPVAVMLLLAGAGAWAAFFFMDYVWYHRLLLGSVEHGKHLEQDLQLTGVPVDLTNCIGRHSPYAILGWKLHSPNKIRFFYGVIFAAVILLALGSCFLKSAPAAQTKPVPAAH